MEHLYEEALAPNLYYDRKFDIDAVKILPGEYYATARPMLVVTVLGSCVAACVRDRASGIGGMNHFMLPSMSDGSDPVNVSARYGTYAMEILVNQLLKLGARRPNLEAKVFGGGNVVRGFTVTNVGERNARFVHDYLKQEKISVVAEDLLGAYPRKVYFFPHTGRALVKQIRQTHNDTLMQREQVYGMRLSASEIAGDVELF